jgi:hypothetical protein
MTRRRQNTLKNIWLTSWFWLITRQTGRCVSPAHRSFDASYSSPKNKLFPETNCFPSGPNFVYLSTELNRTLVSYTAPYWATLRPPELHCPLMSYIEPIELRWTLLSVCCIPTELRCILSELRFTIWAKLHPSEVRCTLSDLHPSEIRCTLWAKLRPSEICCTLLIYAAPFWATLRPT